MPASHFLGGNMAVATISGTLTDCNLQSMAGKQIELLFTLNEPATAGSAFYVTEPIAATITGSTFTVGLADNETMDQIRHYKMSATWLDAAGGFVKVDFPQWEVFVPIGGGSLPDLVRKFSNNPFMIFWQTTEPNPWPVGTVWVDTSVNTATSGDVLRKDS